MKKMFALIAGMLLALPVIAAAQQGIVGDCYDCHTMHNSEQGNPVALRGAGATVPDANPIENLLKMDCMACHANDPVAGTETWTMTGGSVVPQVMHGGDMTNSLAGGNFRFGVGDSRKVHNVNDIFSGQWDTNVGANNEPPGLPHSSDRGAFTVTDAFDAFTCAGARGCHGTRAQVFGGGTADHDGNAATANTYEGNRRTGIAAISGAHHNSYDGVKEDAGYPGEQVHDGQIVADGYRFIPGLYGYGNEVNRWKNNEGADHNEYYGNAEGLRAAIAQAGGSSGCHTCHIEGHAGGYNTRAALNSTIKTPNNSMSGFCSSCHGNFHSAGGAGTAADYTDNGTSGAFLRHPSDYVIPNSSEYQYYTAYTTSAPVSRPSITGLAASSNTVTPGTDMVMCLSCHVAHGSDQDYLLRFDYTLMTAGGYADEATAEAEGGCLACHTAKGVLPENRTR